MCPTVQTSWSTCASGGSCHVCNSCTAYQHEVLRSKSQPLASRWSAVHCFVSSINPWRHATLKGVANEWRPRLFLLWNAHQINIVALPTKCQLQEKGRVVLRRNDPMLGETALRRTYSSRQDRRNRLWSASCSWLPRKAIRNRSSSCCNKTPTKLQSLTRSGQHTQCEAVPKTTHGLNSFSLFLFPVWANVSTCGVHWWPYQNCFSHPPVWSSANWLHD